MSIADRALWVMERNSEQALGLDSIADACGVSRSHLANAFGTATGWPVMKYLRARRLTEAAHRLLAGAPDILTVALEYGYGSFPAIAAKSSSSASIRLMFAAPRATRRETSSSLWPDAAAADGAKTAVAIS